MNFAKTFFASLLAFVAGNVIFGIISFMMIVVFAAVIGSSSQTMAPKVKSNSVLMIDLKGGISDSPQSNPFIADGFGNIRVNNSNTILQAVAAVENAIADSNIKGAYINVGYGGGISMSNVEELRASLQKFRRSGKFIVSYSDNYSQIGYYLSSVADRVYLNPEGGIDWRGLASGVMFYKGLLDKLDIRAEIIRHGSFKSAVEPYMLDSMSPENREQLNTMLNTVWDALLTDISESRGIDKQVLSAYASDLTIDSPEIAYDSGMIDGILYEDQVIDMLGRLAEGWESIGSDEITDDAGISEEEWSESDMEDGTLPENETEEIVADTEIVAENIDVEEYELAEYGEESYDDEQPADSIDVFAEEVDFEVAGSTSPRPNLISLSDYIRSGKPGSVMRHEKNKVAVVYVDGNIMTGDSRGNSVGGRTIAEKLKQAREDKNTKAVVLRVNSPGGSITGAEIIWHELDMTRQEKPVIVSMGGMAASGGYYIACPADMILADRTTLTGSIGVFSLLFDVGDALHKNLGITVDIAKTNPSADIGSGYRRLSSFEKRFLQKQVDDAYSTFIGHVAEGRNMTEDAVDAIGGGRVWSGVSAVENGLVDGFGGIVDAIELAAQRGGAGDNYSIWEVVDSPDNISAIMRSILGSEEIRVNNALGESLRRYDAIIEMLNTDGIQARMLYDIEML